LAEIDETLPDPLDQVGPLPSRRVVLKALFLFLRCKLRESLAHKRIDVAGTTLAPEFN